VLSLLAIQQTEYIVKSGKSPVWNVSDELSYQIAKKIGYTESKEWNMYYYRKQSNE